MWQCLLRLVINSFLKSITKYGKKIEKLLKIEFDSKPVYGDDNKYIKTKIKIYASSMITNFQDKKNAKRKSTIQVFINIMLDSVIEVKEKILSSKTFDDQENKLMIKKK